MGMIADLKNLDSVNPTLNANATKRVLKRYIEHLESVHGDPEYIDEDVSERIEVHRLPQFTEGLPSGEFTLIIDLANGETISIPTLFTSTSASLFQTSINAVATAVEITGWTNDDIIVSGSTLNVEDTDFSFATGPFANKRQPLIRVDDTGLSEPFGPISVINYGQPNRPAVAVAKLIGLIGAAQPIDLLPISNDYIGEPGDLRLNPNELVLKMLATEIGIETDELGVSDNGAGVRNEHLELMRKQGFAI